MAPTTEELVALASDYLVKQGWFLTLTDDDGIASEGEFELVTFELVRTEHPGLARMLLQREDQRFQLLLGWRPSRDVTGALRDGERALLGAAEDGDERVIVYDALADDELCKVILEIATNGAQHARRVRPVASLVSHASLVFDERLFMKCYRVLERETRAEVEIMFKLDEVGFNAMLTPVARWQDHDADLALVREFLPSALEGRLLALTSLRDLLAHASGDESSFSTAGESDDLDEIAAGAGGDLAGEMVRLGETTAHLHVALARAFGTRPLAPADFVTVDADAGVRSLVADGTDDLGVAIRLHGDYHLRRVMRFDAGWLVAGFGDDPLYAIEVRDPSLPSRTGSALEDLADMSYALGQVGADALAQRRDDDNHDRAHALAAAWRRRNRRAFLRGYFRTPGVSDLMPADEAKRDVLLAAFESIRERRYDATSSE